MSTGARKREKKPEKHGRKGEKTPCQRHIKKKRNTKDLSQQPKSVILSVAKDLRFAAINRQILRFAQNDILGFRIGYNTR